MKRWFIHQRVLATLAIFFWLRSLLCTNVTFWESAKSAFPQVFVGWKGPVVIFPEVHHVGQGMRMNATGHTPAFQGAIWGSINLEYPKDPKHKKKVSRYLYYFLARYFHFFSLRYYCCFSSIFSFHLLGVYNLSSKHGSMDTLWSSGFFGQGARSNGSAILAGGLWRWAPGMLAGLVFAPQIAVFFH